VASLSGLAVGVEKRAYRRLRQGVWNQRNSVDGFGHSPWRWGSGVQARILAVGTALFGRSLSVTALGVRMRIPMR